MIGGLLEGDILDKKWNLLMIVVLVVFTIVSITVLYEKKDDSKDMDYIAIDPSKTALVINKPLPLADEAGRELLNKENIDDDYSVYVDFFLETKEDCNYKILINKNDDSNSLKDEYVKIILLDGDTNQVIKKYDGASYLTLNQLEMYKDNYLLYESKLSKKKNRHFKLVMWTSDQYVVSNKKEYFNGVLDIYSY